MRGCGHGAIAVHKKREPEGSRSSFEPPRTRGGRAGEIQTDIAFTCWITSAMACWAEPYSNRVLSL